MSKYTFSLILPIYNEEQIAEKAIKEILELNSNSSVLFDIIIVNDGSNDLTSSILDKFKAIENINLITHEKNYGYGRALKTGITNSKSNVIFITDIDGTYPNEKIIDFAQQFFQNKCDMLIGARDLRSENISLITLFKFLS